MGEKESPPGKKESGPRNEGQTRNSTTASVILSPSRSGRLWSDFARMRQARRDYDRSGRMGLAPAPIELGRDLDHLLAVVRVAKRYEMAGWEILALTAGADDAQTELLREAWAAA